MMSLWVGVALLSMLALGFVFWPLVRYGKQQNGQSSEVVAERLAENVRLFHEHIAELEVQLSAGRIDQEQFAQLKLEQERALLDDEADIRAAQQNRTMGAGIKTLSAIAVLIVAISWGLYQQLGSSADVEIRLAQELKQELDNADYQAGRNPDPVRAREMVRLIQARLADEPEQLQYWFFLARMHMDLNDFAQAVNAYQQVLQRDSSSAMIMAELAQAMFLRDGNKMSPPISDLVEKVLKVEPDNTTALGLAGIDAFGKKDYVGAIKYWEHTVKLTGQDSPGSQALISGIERAATLYFAEGGTEASLAAARAGRQLSVNVSLAEGVDANPDQIVFIYARTWQGAKMPLAITRVAVSELPKQVVLTEAMAMTPAMSLGSVDSIEVIARISQDGTATAKAGDWQGSFGPVDMKSIPSDLNVTIDQKVAQ
ncbi:c-type cytochrome biogenesis protein CcmI [Cellvibrio sp. OA-2007]|uniref:c-type cytochrome biogenesis protein CcmI n=1 Tax=Cellvibrio sp. OA-2007 TaxID=529823 RepID=UPI00078534B4|nr:c-type cytochrome biogenesis protein CcmI [Cellvibrio sp. OA-2007]